MHHATINGEARTNNTCEGFHNSLNYLLGSKNPSLWTFIECLRKAERKQFFFLQQLCSGSQPPPPKKKYRDYDIRLRSVVSTYDGVDLLEYLKNVASNLSFYN